MPRMALKTKKSTYGWLDDNFRITVTLSLCQVWASVFRMNKIVFSKELYKSLDTWYQAVIDVIGTVSDDIKIVEEEDMHKGGGSK